MPLVDPGGEPNRPTGNGSTPNRQAVAGVIGPPILSTRPASPLLRQLPSAAILRLVPYEGGAMLSTTLANEVRWRRHWGRPDLRALTAATSLLALCSGASAQPNVPALPIAEVDGQVITSEEVDQRIGAQLQRLQEQIYVLRRQKLDALIADRLLAS